MHDSMSDKKQPMHEDRTFQAINTAASIFIVYIMTRRQKLKKGNPGVSDRINSFEN